MNAWINDKQIEFQQGETILEAARRHSVFIPTLCTYLPRNHKPGTCRVCLVKVFRPSNPNEAIICTACNTPLEDGMRIYSRSADVRAMQRMQVAWIFADHDQDCASCSRHGNCELQDLALYVGLQHNGCNGRFTAKRPADGSATALFRDVNKCIRCGRCVEICRNVQGLSVLTIDNIGTGCGVGIAGAQKWADSARCVQCGQCSVVCPTGAISEKDETEQAIQWFSDPEIKTIVSFAPAVRVTIGEEFGVPAGTNCERQLITALRRLGADFVCDVNWAADVTIMEEGTELLHRLNNGGKLPMMTSCCPGWINFVEKIHPELIAHLSTTRSPQGIFGSLSKTWFAQQHNIDARKLRFISIMPCTAKKDEAAREQLSKNGQRDTDLVLTVRELARLLRGNGISLSTIPPSDFDSPFMTQNTGAGVIFGATGGVMEAAVRTVYHCLTGQELHGIEYTPVRGMEWIKESRVDIGNGTSIRLAVVHGLANAEKMAQLIQSGNSPYDFIEVMACPGGCINGGGNMQHKNNYMFSVRERTEGLYRIDRDRQYRQSHNNPDVIRLYQEFLEEPCSEMSHELLHTHYNNRVKPGKTTNIREIWDRVQLG